jgi:hypothetical protein
MDTPLDIRLHRLMSTKGATMTDVLTNACVHLCNELIFQGFKTCRNGFSDRAAWRPSTISL